MKAIAAAMCLALSACGGGGDSDDAGSGNPGGSSAGNITLIELSGLAGAANSSIPRAFTVPAGATRLVVRTAGGTGDVDMLVVGPDATPCASTSGSNDETCEFNAPMAGSWQVQLNAFNAYSGVTLTVTVTTGASNGSGGSSGAPPASGITELSSTAYLPGDYVEAGGRVFFRAAEDPPFTQRLWMTDGTPGGTRKLSSTVQASRLMALDGGVMFAAYDPASSQPGLFRATPDGSVTLVKTMPPTPGSSVSGATLLGVWGNRLFFIGDDGVNGRELWSSDGTTAGTHMIANIDSNGDALFEAVNAWTWWNGRLYFYAAPDEINDIPQLYSTNGQAGNLTQLTYSSYVGAVLLDYDMAVFKNRLYFTWRSSTEGVELWSTDGTLGGTGVFHDAYPTAGNSSWPRRFNVVGDRLLFSAYYPGGSGTHQGLFATDGTPGGTTRISDVDMGLFTDRMVAVNGHYLFPGRVPGTYEYSLWRTDGTSAGTVQVALVQPADDRFDGDIAGAGTALLGTKLVFLGRDSSGGYEPWITDGTTAGTSRLADLNPGTGSSFSTNVNLGWITRLGSKAYFTADVGNFDYRLFETDGTTAGTKQVAPEYAAVTTNTRSYNQTPLEAPFAFGQRLLFGARYSNSPTPVLFAR